MEDTKLSVVEKLNLQLRNLNAELTEAEYRSDNAIALRQEKIEAGAVGFYNYLYKTKGDESAKKAADMLTGKDDCGVHTKKGFENKYVPYSELYSATYPRTSTYPYRDNFADSLDSFKSAIEYLKNYYICFDMDEFTSVNGYTPGMLHNVMFAQAQLQLNYSLKKGFFPHVFYSGFEGRDLDKNQDPFEELYFKERYKYERDLEKGLIMMGNNYCNVVANSDYVGLAVGELSNKRKCCFVESKNKRYTIGKSYSYDEYLNIFLKYYDYVMHYDTYALNYCKSIHNKIEEISTQLKLSSK